jgi:hypothetical protein
MNKQVHLATALALATAILSIPTLAIAVPTALMVVTTPWQEELAPGSPSRYILVLGGVVDCKSITAVLTGNPENRYEWTVKKDGWKFEDCALAWGPIAPTEVTANAPGYSEAIATVTANTTTLVGCSLGSDNTVKIAVPVNLHVEVKDVLWQGLDMGSNNPVIADFNVDITGMLTGQVGGSGATTGGTFKWEWYYPVSPQYPEGLHWSAKSDSPWYLSFTDWDGNPEELCPPPNP